ncbi:hypothetical protein Bca4012_027599 [Brassica carinata]
MSTPARSTPGVDLREVLIIPVPERDQVGSFRKRRSSRTFPNDTFLGNRPSDLGLHHVMAQGESVFGNQQHLRSYMPNTMPSTGGEQLQHRVNAHLKNLSRQ